MAAGADARRRRGVAAEVTLKRKRPGPQAGLPSHDPAALARLVGVERRLEALHSALDFTGGSTPVGIIALAFGHRARSLYLGVLDAAEGPSEATAQAALRVLIEQTILLPWLLLNPEVHPFLWKAEHERHLRNLIRDAPTKAGSKFAADLAAGVSDDVLEGLDRAVAAARALAIERAVVGVKNGSLLPGLDVMTAQVGTPEAKEAYHISYNMISGWTHSSAGGLGMIVTPSGVVFDDGPVGGHRAHSVDGRRRIPLHARDRQQGGWTKDRARGRCAPETTPRALVEARGSTLRVWLAEVQ
jgi:hypothetical protein